MILGRWCDRVVRGEVNGHPSVMHADRVGSIAELLEASRRWAEREYLIHRERRKAINAYVDIETAVITTV